MRHLTRPTVLALLVSTVAALTLVGPAPAGAAGTTQRLPDAPTARGDAHVGFSVATGGGVVLVGAPGTDARGLTAVGAVYVYPQGSATALPTAELQDVDGQDSDQFGFSVAVSGDYALVGAPYAASPTDPDGGKVYVYRRSGDTWTRVYVLEGAPGDVRYGQSLAIEGDRMAVLAPVSSSGSARTTFYRLDTSGERPRVVRTGSYTASGVTTDATRYNHQLAIQRTTLVIGDPYADPDGVADRGVVVVLSRLGYTWDTAHPRVLTDGAVSAGGNLGGTVAIDGPRIVAGAPHAGVGRTSQAGEASVFIAKAGAYNGGWVKQATLKPGYVDRYGICGGAVAIHATTILVGCPFVYYGTGVVSTYRASGGSWVRDSANLAAPDVEYGEFGYAIAPSETGDGFYIGSPNASGADGNRLTGAVYLHTEG